MLGQPVDVASFAHLFNFMIVGVLFPNNYIGAFILGIIWELIEECITNTDFSRDLLLRHFKDYQSLWDETNKNKLMDISLNMVGYYLGNKIRDGKPL